MGGSSRCQRHTLMAIASERRYPTVALLIGEFRGTHRRLEARYSARRVRRRTRSENPKEFMDRTAPLNNAQKIKKPLLIIQGQNDPRVPAGDAAKLVAATKDRILSGTSWRRMKDTVFSNKPTATIESMPASFSSRNFCSNNSGLVNKP